MKKLFFVLAICAFFGFYKAGAQQQGGDQATMMQHLKERLKPQLMEKTKLTDSQADRVLEIHMNARQQMHGLKDMNEEDKKKKMEEIRAGIDKEYKSIPLTEDQIKDVNSFFEEQRKLMQQKQQNKN